VINLEICDLPTTDVMGVGEHLPFRDHSFDAVFSLAVLEHVRDPFACAREIARVLKPGGVLYAAVPFLQPFHGYPDHYYNMTSHGLRNLFAQHLRIDELGVPASGKPFWALNWILRSYVNGLPADVAQRFRGMTVDQLLGDPLAHLPNDYVTALSPAADEELACVNYLLATKPS
jgi:SAM-dependent methyltransferase